MLKKLGGIKIPHNAVIRMWSLEEGTLNFAFFKTEDEQFCDSWMTYGRTTEPVVVTYEAEDSKVIAFAFNAQQTLYFGKGKANGIALYLQKCDDIFRICFYSDKQNGRLQFNLAATKDNQIIQILFGIVDSFVNDAKLKASLRNAITAQLCDGGNPDAQ